MNELVTLITCTGFRPHAWALCQKYAARQTYKGPIQWIIINDDPKTPLVTLPEVTVCENIKQEFYQGPLPWRPGINTQRPNMMEALKYVKGDFIFTWEDDDWYASNFLETMLYLLHRWSIVGQCNSHYYNIKERSWKAWGNVGHTSLNETGLRKSKLDLLDRAVNSGQLFFDMMLWQIANNEHHDSLIFNHQNLVIGMKGLPGKVGIGGGHHETNNFTPDPFFETLRSWVGPEDAKVYANLMVQNVKS